MNKPFKDRTTEIFAYRNIASVCREKDLLRVHDSMSFQYNVLHYITTKVLETYLTYKYKLDLFELDFF